MVGPPSKVTMVPSIGVQPVFLGLDLLVCMNKLAESKITWEMCCMGNYIQNT